MAIKYGRPSHANAAGSPAPDEIKAARVEAGLSQERAADSLRVATRTWTRWEYGATAMHPLLWAEWREAIKGGGSLPIEPPSSDQIKAARIAANLTQRQAARVLDVSEVTWRNWEIGRDTMRPALWSAWSRGVMTMRKSG